MAELDRQGGAGPPDFGRLSQSRGEDPAAKDKGIYNIHNLMNQRIGRKLSDVFVLLNIISLNEAI